MHILTLPKTIETIKLGPKDQIPAGKYIAEDVSAGQLLAMAGEGTMEVLTEKRPLDESADYNGKSILIVRMGGFGDMVAMTPLIREIKLRWPECTIHVSTMNLYGQIFDAFPAVEKCIPYPVPLEEAQKYAAWLFFQDAIERNPEAEKVHITDMFAKIAGFAGKDWTDNKHPQYDVTENEKIWCEEAYPRIPGVRRLALQVGASAQARVYSTFQMSEVINHFKKLGWEIFMIGRKGEVPDVTNTDFLKNLTLDNLPFRKGAAVVASSDVFIGSDSAFAHVAGALGVPAVALFGPFIGKLRHAYSPSVHVLQGTGKCKPCFHHCNPIRRNEFPTHCPTRNATAPGFDPADPQSPKGHCLLLDSTKPKEIIKLIEKIARKAPLELVN